MESALRDIKETMDQLESTLDRAEATLGPAQRETYKKLLKYNWSPREPSEGFIRFLGHILQGKPTQEARRRTLLETMDQEKPSTEEEINMGLTLIDTLPFGDLKQYYITVLEQGLKEANTIWARREKNVFRS